MVALSALSGVVRRSFVSIPVVPAISAVYLNRYPNGDFEPILIAYLCIAPVVDAEPVVVRLRMNQQLVEFAAIGRAQRSRRAVPTAKSARFQSEKPLAAWRFHTSRASRKIRQGSATAPSALTHNSP